MASETQEWFIFRNDRHEGPFSVSEIREMIAQGEVLSTDYAWSEGMEEWQTVGSLKELKTAAAVSNRVEIPSETSPPPYFATTPLPWRRRASDKRKVSTQWRLGAVVAGAVVTVLAIVFLAYPTFYRSSETVSALPTLTDVSAEEYRELRIAASESLRKIDPLVAVAISTEDQATVAPTFYVATNLPPGARFDIYFEGVPDTLLNQVRVSGSATLSVPGRLVKTPPIRLANGQGLPRGMYRIFVVDSANQPADVRKVLESRPALQPLDAGPVPPTAKLLARKTYFLGGVKDAAYEQGLRNFHVKLAEQARAELYELSQFIATMENQLSETDVKFQEIRVRERGDRLAARKKWKLFESEWSAFENKLNEFFQKWPRQPSRESSSEKFFYAKLYSLLLTSHDLVNRLHADQNAFFEAEQEDASIEMRIAEATSAARSAILSLRSKIDSLEKAGLTPSGMPQRD